jgi:hypothetical protein
LTVHKAAHYALLGVVRRAYQHANTNWRWKGDLRPTKASAKGGRDEEEPPASRPLQAVSRCQSRISLPLSGKWLTYRLARSSLSRSALRSLASLAFSRAVRSSMRYCRSTVEMARCLTYSGVSALALLDHPWREGKRYLQPRIGEARRAIKRRLSMPFGIEPHDWRIRSNEPYFAGGAKNKASDSF